MIIEWTYGAYAQLTRYMGLSLVENVSVKYTAPTTTKKIFLDINNGHIIIAV